MTRIWTVLFVAACGNATPRQAPSVAPPPEPTPSGHDDLVAPLYAGMFVDGATFEYTVYAYKVDKYGTRHDAQTKQVTCFIHDLVFMHQLQLRSARLTCDEPGPLNGVMFAGRDGFWWCDEQRYLAGGFVPDPSTRIFDREPKEIESMDDRLYSVRREEDGAWCWSESFSRPWTSQGLCLAGGRIVSGWAANQATDTTSGDYIEFELAR
jgi:hypothetical protein